MKYIILNSFLSLILLFLLFSIAKEEIEYKRYERFEWTSDVDVTDSTNTIRVIEGFLKNKNLNHDIINYDNRDKIIYSGLYQITDSHKNELLPDSLKIKWFSYKDDAFYQINEALPYDKIIEILNSYVTNELQFEIVFNNKGKIDLYLGNGYKNKQIFITTFKAKKINQKWTFNKNKVQDVFLMNSKAVFNPYIEITSNSKFKSCRTYFFDQYQSSFDSISNEKLYHFSTRKPRPFKSISFELSNDKFENGNLYFSLDFSEDELFNCLTKMSDLPKKLEVKLDEKDSVRSVFLSDSEKRFQLKELKHYD